MFRHVLLLDLSIQGVNFKLATPHLVVPVLQGST